jgi:hypothetical protein
MSFLQESHPDDPSFLTLAHRAPIMIWMSGLDMGCFYFNRAWLDFRGRLLAEEYGNGWAEGVHPDDLDQCVAHYVGCFERRVPFVMSYRLRHFSGAYHWILDRGAPHFSPDGRFLGFFGGCAETAKVPADILRSQLRINLDNVAAFARELAGVYLEAPDAEAGSRTPLKIFAHNLRRAGHDRAREMKHAAGEFEKLAADMLAHGDISNGECLVK